MNVIIRNGDDEVIKKSNGINIPQQIAYTSVDDLFVDDVEYYIVRKIFDPQDNELIIIVEKVK